MLKLSITLPNNAHINLESEDSVVIDKILGTVLENVTRALLSGSPSFEWSSTPPAPPVELMPVGQPAGEGDLPPLGRMPSEEAQAQTPAAAPDPAPEQTPARPESLFSLPSATTGDMAEPPAQEAVQGLAAEFSVTGDVGPELERAADWNGSDAFGAVTDAPNGYPQTANSHLNPSNLMPAVSEQAFIDFCRAANPLGDMRRVVVAAEGASRYLAMEGVDAEALGQLFDKVGWPRAHNFVQALRNAARSKFGWLERVPGRAGHYTVTNLGRATALGR